MNPVTEVRGRAAPLSRSDVDTDQIIPSDWLKRIERTGFGQGLFSEWRKDPAFVLNDPRYRGASILIAGANFGSGSSREHAAWALDDYGFKAVISERFADIFRSNALKNGLLPVQLPAETVATLFAAVEADPATEIVIDVAKGRVDGAGVHAEFALDEFMRQRLLNGWDDIGLTLRHADGITAYESKREARLPRIV